MKQRHASAFLGAALLTALLASGAGAQNLTAYRQMAAQLDAAAQSSGKDALQTLRHLDAAGQALDELAPTVSNARLVGGMRDALNAARAAQSRTPTELQAQVLLARGVMRKALYDQTVAVLATSPDNALERLSLLAEELGADPQALRADAKAGKLNLVTWRLQKTAAGRVAAAMQGVQPTQNSASYLNLARATSWFTVVQEAGRNLNPSLDVPQFQQALAELAGGNIPALKRSLGTLNAGVKALNVSLATVPAAVVTRPRQETVPVVAGDPRQPAASGQPTRPPATTPPATTRQSGAGLDAAYAALGHALTAAGHADMETARAALATVPRALAGAPAAVRGAAGYDHLIADVQALAGRKGLRPGDVQALIAELGALEQQAAGRPVSTLDSLSGGVSRSLGGGVRAILSLLIALVCGVPLYLLNLAFGGRNPYWRAISMGLALLLLPVFLEGTFGFLGWLGDLSGVGALRSLTNITLSQGAYGLPWLALLNIAAIGLTIYGFRGLCVQFGLLGTRTARKKTPQKASAENPSADQTSFDWDEDV